MYHQDNKYTDFFWGAMVGGAVATLTTLLFTTKKGSQIQKKIADKYHEVEEGFSEAKEKVEETAHDVSKKAGHAVHKLKKDE